jgi:hypothetical protein
MIMQHIPSARAPGLSGLGLYFKIEVDHRDPAERGRDFVAELKLLRARMINAEENLTEYI